MRTKTMKATPKKARPLTGSERTKKTTDKRRAAGQIFVRVNMWVEPEDEDAARKTLARAKKKYETEIPEE